MKLPPFTLVHTRSPGLHDATFKERAGVALGHLRRSLRETLAASVKNGVLEAAAVRLVGEEMQRQKHVKTVGVWDLGAWVGRLPEVIETLNKAQAALVIFEIQAAIPSGLSSRKDRVAFWARKALGRKLRNAERDHLSDAIIDDEFFAIAEPVRRDVGVDYLIGITPESIAGKEKEDDTVYSDLFFSGDGGRVSLISTSDLRKFGKHAGRPFEFAVAFVFLGALLSMLNPKVAMHDDRGCLFDFNYERRKIVPGLRSPMIEDQCMKDIRASYRETAKALIHALSQYGKFPGTNYE